MAKVIDRRGKFFGKISIIDVLLIVLILGLAAGFGYKKLSAPAQQIVNANTKFYATFIVEKVRDFSVQSVAVGDVLYEQYGTQPLGKIVAVRSEQSYDVLKNPDGTAINAPMDGKYNIYMTIEASGSVNSGGYYFNGNEQMAVGSDVTLQSNMFICSARVYKLATDESGAE
ncbi:MAG: DUF4330 domain-containing protein [Defluviitaleaceae bacterium]|nr:DUF4330 domain-containing protein [Defluviitaleaceae bacterium]